MKFLLTSSGLTNHHIEKELLNLLGKDFSLSRVVFIPTASNVEADDKWWVIKDLVSLQKLGFNSLDIVDISALPKELWLPRLRDADVLFFEGGNVFHLMREIQASHLDEELVSTLAQKVWVCVSAGSMVLAPDLMLTVFQKLYEEDQSEKENIAGLHLVPFYILPHLNSEWFEKVREKEIRELLQNCPYPVYTLDDETALSVVGDVIKVIGDGEWFLIEKTKQD